MKITFLLFFILFMNFQVFIPITTQSGTKEDQPFNISKGISPVYSINKTSSNNSNKLILSQEGKLTNIPIKPDITTSTNSTLFISKWNTAFISSQSSNTTQVKLPLLAGGNYNFTVNWGDGSNNTITSYNQSVVTHTYATAGVYTITINGTLEGWAFHNQGDKLKIIDISQWGNLQFGNSGGYFYGCYYLLITASDSPNLNGTTSMIDAFKNCGNLVGIGQTANWNVSNITNMSGMFAYTYAFDQSINNWNVSNVQDMSNMFYYATTFNESLNSWNVSRVTTMFQMFDNARSFNSAINKWDISRVTTIAFMFFGDSAFNQPLGNWNVSSVTNMSHMLAETNFNQPIGSWDISNVKDMSSMFYYAENFEQPLSLWNVSQVTTMSQMFSNDYVFNQYIDNWDVSNVKNMANMFSYATGFNEPLNEWNVFQVTTMVQMFSNDQIFNQPLDKWDVLHVTNMSHMFQGDLAFSQNINSWNVSNVLDMSYMFSLTDFNSPINNWNVSKVTDLAYMFYQDVYFNQPINNWDVSEVSDMSGMLSGTILIISNYDNLLIAWSKLNLKSNVEFDVSAYYSNRSVNARNYIIKTFNWKINDNGISKSFGLSQTSLVKNSSSIYIKYIGLLIFVFILIGLILGFSVVFHNFNYDYYIKNYSSSKENSPTFFLEMLRSKVNEERVKKPFESAANIIKMNYERKKADNLRREVLRGNFENINQLVEAKELGAKNLQELQLVKQLHAPDYLTATKILSGKFEDMEQYQTALDLGAKTLWGMHLVEKFHAPDYKTAIKIRAGNFEDMTQYSSALAVGAKNLQELQLVERFHASDYITATKIISGDFEDMTQYSKALALGAQNLQELQLVERVHAPDYRTAIKIFTGNFKDMAQYQTALDLGAKSLQEMQLVEKYHAPDYITAMKINAGNFVDLEQYTRAKSLGANTLEELKLVESTKAPDYILANKVKNFGFSNYEIYKKATTNGFFDKESWELFQKRHQKLIDYINNGVDVLRENFKKELDIPDTDELLILLDNLNVPLQGSYILFSNFKTETDVSSLIKDISSNKSKKLFTEYKFRDKIQSNQRVENCKICFKPLIGIIGYCPTCLNETHYNCLTNWVMERHTCPMCRQKLELGNIIQLEKGKLSVCLLCKKLFIKNEKIIRCEECLSTYHKAEFLEWVKVKGSCPNCNQKINF